MSEPRFTKGEWIARVNNLSGVHCALVYLSDKGGFDISGAPDCIANAHLIAAAPEMYVMLNFLVLSDNILEQSAVEDVSSLLEKARGEL